MVVDRTSESARGERNVGGGLLNKRRNAIKVRKQKDPTQNILGLSCLGFFPSAGIWMSIPFIVSRWNTKSRRSRSFPSRTGFPEEPHKRLPELPERGGSVWVWESRLSR